MADDFRFWLHGTGVQIEYTQPQLDLQVRRAGWGCVIRQKPETHNWFHFPITTPSRLDDDAVKFREFYLKGRINDGAIIKKIHVWHGSPLDGSHGQRIQELNNLQITDRLIDKTVPIPIAYQHRLVAHASVLCVYGEFVKAGGEIVFTGAGALFEEQ